MSKSVQNVKNSLKFKAPVKSGLLTVRVGVKKYVIPVAARMLSSEGHMFLSFNATSELYEIKDKKKLVPMDAKADGTAALEALNPRKRTSRRKSTPVALPSELENALQKIPSGYKLVINADGSPRLAKTRKRRSKKK